MKAQGPCKIGCLMETQISKGWMLMQSQVCLSPLVSILHTRQENVCVFTAERICKASIHSLSVSYYGDHLTGCYLNLNLLTTDFLCLPARIHKCAHQSATAASEFWTLASHTTTSFCILVSRLPKIGKLPLPKCRALNTQKACKRSALLVKFMTTVVT